MESLIAEILRSVGPGSHPMPAPKLTGSLCRDRYTLFDLEDIDTIDRQYVADRALDLCWQCPVLKACADWAAHQRFPGFTGVIAGRIIGDARLEDSA